MKELAINQLSKTYGIKVLLDNIDFSIRTGDRVGIIGPNGTGKSSLLKVIAGIDTYDKGEINKPNQYSVAYLDQNVVLNEEETILDAVYQSQSPMVSLLLKYERLLNKIAEYPEDEAVQASFNQVTDEMNLKNAWDFETQAKTILSKLGIYDLNRKIRGCSGGERKRIGLAQVLIAEPDLLILDEPTNHLDIQSIQWLEKYLTQYKGALLLVTHDRYFLENSVNKIIELKFGKISEYEGNYQYYLTQRAERALIEEKMQNKQDRLFQQELAWMRKGAKARTTKQQARIDRFNELKEDIHARDIEDAEFSFNFDQQRIGNRIVDFENVSISVAHKSVINGFTKSIIKNDRVGVIGPNGIGKSTFLNAIAGLHPVDEGHIEIGQTVRMVYYRQLDEDLPADMRVLTFLTQVADNFKRPDGSIVSASQMLERFNFSRESHGTLIGQLSGGERRRLYLLSLLIQEPNVILFDEPTNDLDIETLTVLEDYLDQFEGAVFIVSHDRYFLDKTVDQLIHLKGSGEYDLYYGNYSEFLEHQQNIEKENVKEKAQITKTTPKNSKSDRKRMSYHEKKEWQTIEEDIMQLELLVDEIKENMLHCGSDAGKLIDLQKELEEIEDKLAKFYERYDYLSEFEQ